MTHILEFLQKHGTTITIKSGEHLFYQGDTHNSIYVVKSGLLKAYYLSAKGKEHIKSFILADSFIGSLTAAYAGQSSSFSLVSMQPSKLLKIEFNSFNQAGRANVEVASAMIDVLLAFAMKKEKREYELLCLSAEERYRGLLKNSPQLLKMVTQNEIALYLGVTPVGLSRIKKRVTGDGS
ncbi:MAG: Crp/Fnr family transcriptional regulator [Devosiaceae bacterium]|nr:Crp/Fnr family transcriptional regulator [Devosiaceae bacterium]